MALRIILLYTDGLDSIVIRHNILSSLPAIYSFSHMVDLYYEIKKIVTDSGVFRKRRR